MCATQKWNMGEHAKLQNPKSGASILSVIKLRQLRKKVTSIFGMILDGFLQQFLVECSLGDHENWGSPDLCPGYASYSCGTKTYLLLTIPSVQQTVKHGHLKPHPYSILNHSLWTISDLRRDLRSDLRKVSLTEFTTEIWGSPTTFWSTTVPSSDTNSSTPRLGYFHQILAGEKRDQKLGEDLKLWG